MPSIHIIGGGLAGTEAAWQAAAAGVRVVLHEMRPTRPTAVLKTDKLAELVCSNSFRGDKLDNAVGLLKEEMRRLGSLVMRAAEEARVPAGAALAVDRERFSAAVTNAITSHPLIEVRREEVPAAEVEKEKNIYRAQMEKEGKPANVLEKIIEGKLGSFYSQFVLLDQPYIRDDKMSVSQLVAQASAKTGENIQISRFVRFRVGEAAE